MLMVSGIHYFITISIDIPHCMVSVKVVKFGKISNLINCHKIYCHLFNTYNMLLHDSTKNI